MGSTFGITNLCCKCWIGSRSLCTCNYLRGKKKALKEANNLETRKTVVLARHFQNVYLAHYHSVSHSSLSNME